MKYILFAPVGILVFIPELALALDPLFSCHDGGSCDFCDLAKMIKNVTDWLVIVATLIAVIGLMYSGFRMVSSRGDVQSFTAAKQMFGNIAVGIVVIMTAFIIVDTIMKALAGGELGMWNKVQCGAGQFDVGTAKYGIKLDNHQVDVSPESLTTDTYGGGAGYGSDIANIGTGNTAIVAFADKMKAKGCIYNQAQRNGCKGSPGYTDCSDLVNVAYRAAGCSSPGTYTGDMIGKSEPIGNPADLRPGDALIHRTGGAGHVVICRNSGCSAVIHAAGTGKNIINSNGSYYYSQSRYRVIRASNYCS